MPASISWLLVWTSASCFLVCGAYAGLGPRLFGKRANGRIAWWSILLLAPFLAIYQTLWHAVRLLGREPACHEVAPGVWLGRRPLIADLPDDIERIVDLCVEFPASAKVLGGRQYLTLPTLDAGLGDAESFRNAVQQIAADPSPVYIHCASGHGRSAMFASAILMKRRIAGSVEEAEEQLQRCRAGVRMSPRQRDFVRKAMTLTPGCSSTG